MNKNLLGGLVGGIFIGLILAWYVVPQFSYGPMMSGYGWGMMGSRTDGTKMVGNIDEHFIEQMIPHHDGAIAMAKLALERSKRPEILSLSSDIIEAQTRENRDMRAWYESWFGGEVPASGQFGMMAHMGSVSGDIRDLEAASDFDRELIEQMIPHHEMAIMMARMLAAGTERAEMSELADQIITSQSREIEMMRGWQDTWY